MAISTGSDIKFIKAPSKYAFLNDKNSIATYGKNSVVFFQDTNEIFLDNKLYSSKIYPNLYTGGDMSINEAWRVVDFSTQHGLAIIQDLFDPIPHIIYQASSNLINTNIF